jgi:hypothetical protein
MNDEKQFLHTLATPVGTALLLLDALLENSKSCDTLEVAEVSELKTALTCLGQIQKLIQERRRILAAERGEG